MFSLLATVKPCDQSLMELIDKKKHAASTLQKVIITINQKSIIKECQKSGCKQELWNEIIEQEVAHTRGRIKAYTQLIGIAVIVSVMAQTVGSYIDSTLASFLTFFAGMMAHSALSPLSRKIFSLLDRKAFRLIPRGNNKTQDLEKMWEDLNSTFSVNEQMSVNQLTKLIDSIELRLNNAHTYQLLVESLLQILYIYDNFYSYIHPQNPHLLNTFDGLSNTVLKEIDLSQLKLDIISKANYRCRDDYIHYLDMWLPNEIQTNAR
jgi:hypothetical protein